jgi:hypothetical protein
MTHQTPRDRPAPDGGSAPPPEPDERIALYDDLCLQRLIEADPELRELNELTQFSEYARATLAPQRGSIPASERVRRIEDHVLRSIGAISIATSLLDDDAQDRLLRDKISAYRAEQGPSARLSVARGAPSASHSRIRASLLVDAPRCGRRS